MVQNVSSWIGRIDLQRLIDAIGERLDAFFSLGTLDSISDRISSDDERLLAEVENVMASNPYGSKFSHIVEGRFKQSTAEPRRKLFVRTAIFGALVYNLFLLVDALVIPDVMWLAVPLQLGIVTPITILFIVLILRFGVDPEIPAFISLLTMVAGSILLFSLSRSPQVNLFVCVFTLFLVAGNVALAIGFGTALLFSVVSVVAVSIASLLHPSLNGTDRIFSIAFLVATASYSLAGSYRIEAGVRTAYLFALREGLRARLLEVSNRKLKTLVGVDGLTGVGNRRSLDEGLQARWHEPAVDRPLAFLLIDIDHFKQFNDDHGHQTGDECLRQVAQALAGEMPGEAMTLARYGGEEFAVVIDDVAPADFTLFAEHLRRTVEMLCIETETGAVLSVTISIGCAVVTPSNVNTPAELIGAADVALYQAKRAGRNRVEIARLKPYVPTAGQTAVMRTMRHSLKQAG